MAYLYNITINVATEIRGDFEPWLQTTHIPQVMGTGLFTEAKLVLVTENEETGGITYATQYVCASAEKLKEYYRNFAPDFNRNLVHKFPGKVHIFGTELRVLAVYKKDDESQS